MRVIEVVEYINPNENNEPYVEPLVPKLRKVAGIYPMPVLEVLESIPPPAFRVISVMQHVFHFIICFINMMVRNMYSVLKYPLDI